MINAILWQLRTGAPWRDLPERHGLWKTACERLRKWTADGTWERILTEEIVKTMRSERWSGPPASIPARSEPSSTPPEPGKGGCSAGWIDDLAVCGEHLGRSRGGLTSKTHLAVDGRGLPMAALLTAGQAGDNPQLLPLLTIRSRSLAPARDAEKRPQRVVTDRAYSPLYPGGAARPRQGLHLPRTR